ncbi:hypothetical protein [Rhizobium sp. RU36D]|uniref:hypothetical protein n=1 Tax=Rhizobium sp. RU36D TaxID=1907415 RepID=UPI0009D8EA8F|nr:hypothetical protein [Rhizobium sp. RU36D]SMD18501.1 hypothetical protein SAMN05880593_13520 [Rhizobium sp. RU36D]
MVDAFDRLALVSRGTVERVHGKAVTVYPVSRVDQNAKPKLSLDEAPYDTVACFYSNTLMENDAKAQPMTGNGRMTHRSLQLTASIRIITGRQLLPGDFLKRTADDALFTIVSFDPDGLGNVLAVIAAAKALPEA